MKTFILLLCIVLFIIFFGRQLLPGNEMFQFHDVSQPGRVAEFVFDLKNMQIPPRVAPHMSYEMGYPVFNYYAPFSYWVTSIIHLAGFDIPDSIKLSFIFALLTALCGMYLFLKQFFKEVASVFGAALYVTSPYVAMEIFARGNLGEIWFLALFPLSLYLLSRNDRAPSYWTFVATAVVTSFVLTAHNVLSLLFLPFVILFILTTKNVKQNIMALIGALLLSAYFLVPAVLESGFISANKIALLTNYKDHFLCWWQIWTTPFWGYGASNPGCDKDGISFMLGKVQVLLGVIGLTWFIFHNYKHIEKRTLDKKLFTYVLIALLLIISTLMTVYLSEPVWRLIPFIQVFQFPWRFLIFSLFGLAFFAAYFFSSVKFPVFQILIPISLVFIFISQSKYFYKPAVSKTEFSQRYLSDAYITNNLAYRVAEYLPKDGDYSYWRELETNATLKDELLKQTSDFIYPLDKQEFSVVRADTFHKKAVTTSSEFLINIHYVPFWQIKINNKEYSPTQFDSLARPIIKLSDSKEKMVELHFSQTPVEVTANMITVLGIIVITFMQPSIKRKDNKESNNS